VKRALISVLISAAMVIAPLPAMSADTGPLPSGTAAGVKQAQSDDNTPLYWLVGAGVVIGLGVLILSNNNKIARRRHPRRLQRLQRQLRQRPPKIRFGESYDGARRFPACGGVFLYQLASWRVRLALLSTPGRVSTASVRIQRGGSCSGFSSHLWPSLGLC